MIQFAMAMFGIVALWLATCQRSARLRRWAPVVGLCGQPAWLIYSWQAEAWGLMALSVVYTAVYVRGIYVQFFKEPE